MTLTPRYPNDIKKYATSINLDKNRPLNPKSLFVISSNEIKARVQNDKIVL